MRPATEINTLTFPQLYERWLVQPLFEPWVDDLLDRVELRPGDRLLDVACGTGIVARRAKERLGTEAQVVGVDVSEPMLSVARSIDPSIDWRLGNASALPVDSGERFDVVACQQGLQFFPDKPGAATEMRRVLDAGGRLAVATWRSLDDVPFFRELHEVAEGRLGSVVDRRHGFGDATALEEVLAAAGFADIRIESVARTIRFTEPDVFVRLNAMAVVGMSAAGPDMDEAQRAQAAADVAADSMEVLNRYTDGDAVAFVMVTNVAIARR